MDLPRHNILAFRIALVTALLVITHLATTSLQYPVVEGMYDKANHVMAFYTLAFLADFSFPHKAFGRAKVLSLLGYGLALEFIQYFLPYRAFSLYDLSGDAAGIFLYWISLPAIRYAPGLRWRWGPQAKNRG